MKRILSLLLAIVMLFSIVAVIPAANAASLYNVRIEGKYHQSQARALLQKVNAFRSGTNAWAWNNSNTQKVSYPKLKSFTYDYELEQIAMQRAAEIALYYGASYSEDKGQNHTRPSGKSWETAHTNYNTQNGYAIGENLFAAVNCDLSWSAEEAFDAWLEADKKYDGQWHRRNMLSVPCDFVSTAFACFEVNDVFYWVELFRSKNINPTPTAVSEETTGVDVQFNQQFLDSFELNETNTRFSMQTGESIRFTLSGALVTTGNLITYYDKQTGEELPVPTAVKVTPALSSSDSSILRISGNTIQALKVGTVTVTATALGKSLRYTVTVLPQDLAEAVVTLDKYADTYIYSGKPITPQIKTVQLGDAVLSPSDYSATYSDNVEIGSGTLTIVGKGNYTGVATKTFQIIDKSACTHHLVFDPAVAPTCEKAGKTAGWHCEICDTALTPQEQIPSFGGHIWSEQITQKATLSANGKIYRTCQRESCGDIQLIKTIYYPKTFTISKETFTYNGKVQKPKFAVKDSAGKTISTAHFAYSIPNGKKVGKYKMTAKFKGNYSGTKYLYYYIRPKNTSKFALSSAKKGFKVKWYTQKNQTKGYQIQYSLYADFRDGKTFTLKDNRYSAATISKLTGGKKYYVRMRTYHTVKFEGKAINVFSFWSGKKTVTTKK